MEGKAGRAQEGEPGGRGRGLRVAESEVEVRAHVRSGFLVLCREGCGRVGWAGGCACRLSEHSDVRLVCLVILLSVLAKLQCRECCVAWE